jgi:hypothetical protein
MAAVAPNGSGFRSARVGSLVLADYFPAADCSLRVDYFHPAVGYSHFRQPREDEEHFALGRNSAVPLPLKGSCQVDYFPDDSGFHSGPARSLLRDDCCHLENCSLRVDCSFRRCCFQAGCCRLVARCLDSHPLREDVARCGPARHSEENLRSVLRRSLLVQHLYSDSPDYFPDDCFHLDYSRLERHLHRAG